MTVQSPRSVEFPPVPARDTDGAPGKGIPFKSIKPSADDLAVVRAHVIECIRTGWHGTASVGVEQAPAEKILDWFLDYMYEEGPQAVAAAREEAKALAALTRSTEAYLAASALGTDPHGCRDAAKDLLGRLRQEQQRRREMSRYELSYENIWKIQKGGSGGERSFVGARGTTFWLDGARMAMVEALLVRDEARRPRFVIDGPDWFEDARDASDRWTKVHDRG